MYITGGIMNHSFPAPNVLIVASLTVTWRSYWGYEGRGNVTKSMFAPSQ